MWPQKLGAIHPKVQIHPPTIEPYKPTYTTIKSYIESYKVLAAYRVIYPLYRVI